MSLFRPAKLLPIRFDLQTPQPSDFYSRKYKYSATITLLNPQIHSDVSLNGSYNLTDLNVGDYVATNGGGMVMKVTEIISQSTETASVYVEDEYRFNQQQDPTGNKTPYIPSSEGIIFEVRNGKPVLFPYSIYSENIIGFVKESAVEILSRFDYLRIDKDVFVDQTDSHTLNLVEGDLLTWDDTTLEYRLLEVDDILVGVVTNSDIPLPDTFLYNPIGSLMDISLPDFSDNKHYYYWDNANPGKLTTTIPAHDERSLPVFFKISDTQAIYLEGGNGTNFLSNYVTLDTPQDITETKTFTADQVFTQDVNVQGNLHVNTDVLIDGNFTVTGETTLVETTNTSITDQIIELNKGYPGSSLSADSGVVINKGTVDNNLFFGWDASTSQFTVGYGTFDGLSTGDLSLTDGDVRFGSTEISGTLSASAQATLASANIEDLTNNRIVIVGANGELEDDANLTWDGQNLVISGTSSSLTTGSIFVGNSNNTGSVHETHILYGTTTDATETELFLDATVDERIVIENHSTVFFDVDVVGRSNSGGNHLAYKIQGSATRLNDSVTTIDYASTSIFAQTDNAWDVSVTVDDTFDTLRVLVTGGASDTIKWASLVKITRITY